MAVSLQPGLFHLPLTVFFENETVLLEREKSFKSYLEQHHVTIHPVLHNLIALINHRSPVKKYNAVKILEGVFEENPNHLNTIANLETIYRELYQEENANTMKKRKDKIVHSQDSKDIGSKAQCLLEQGYVLHFEKCHNIEGGCIQQLSEVRRMLKLRCYNLDRDSDQLGIALKGVDSSICHTYCNMFDRYANDEDTNTDEIEMFEEGLKLLKASTRDTEEEYVWKYFIVCAYRRFIKFAHRTEQDEHRITQICKDSIKYIVENIKKFSTTVSMKNYVAKSYIYLGKFLQHIDTSIVNEYLEGSALESTTKHLFEKALELFPDDRYVLDTYVRSIIDEAKDSNDFSRKQKLLQTAYQLSTGSRTSKPLSHYSYINLALIKKRTCLLSKDPTQLIFGKNVKQLLKESRLDCMQSMALKATGVNVGHFAGISQMLAKFPDFFRFGLSYVRNPSYIYEAIQYLNYTLQLGNFDKKPILLALGSALREVGQFRMATEWMKRAMYLSNNRIDRLTDVCRSILDLHEREYRQELLNELLFVLGEGVKMSQNVDKTISLLCKEKPDGIFALIKFQVNHVTPSQTTYIEVLTKCIEILCRKTENGERKTYLENLKHQAQRKMLFVLLSPEDDTVTHFPSSLNIDQQQKQDLDDFSVCHSNADKDWVNGFLIHQLKTKLYPQDVALTGTIVGNAKSMRESRNTLIILTPSFLQTVWPHFFKDRELEQALQEKITSNTIYLVVLEHMEKSNYPSKLKGVRVVDMSDTKKCQFHLQKLKVLLSMRS